MENVEYKNMASGETKNGANYLEAAVGALNVGDVVVKVVPPARARGFRAPRGKPVTTIETYTVKEFGGEFYSNLLNTDAVRAYCDRTIEFKTEE